MKTKISNILLSISYTSAILSLLIFAFLKIPFLFENTLTFSESKSFLFTCVSILSVLSYFIYILIKREIFISKSYYVNSIYILAPIILILSTISSYLIFKNNLVILGKDISINNLLSFLLLFFSLYIISTNFKKYISLTFISILTISFITTIPTIIAIILSKFDISSISSYLLILIDNWDVVAIASGIISIFSLVFYEIYANSRMQKLLSLILLIIHLLLISMIVMPDIWYAVAFSSLFILFIALRYKGESLLKFYKKLSFIIFIISVLFSIIFSLKYTNIQKVSTYISEFYTNKVGINYNFVKPELSVSMNMGISELKKGRIFGVGVTEFSNIWNIEKPNLVLESSFWNTKFNSSYSAFTTIFVTLGIIAIIFIIYILILNIINIYKNIKNNISDLNKKEKFYFINSIALYIYANLIFFSFVNISISIPIFILFTAIIMGYIYDFKYKIYNSYFILTIFAIFLIIINYLFIFNINKIRSVIIINNSLKSFQIENNINTLESNLLKSIKISKTDTNYRLLTQFYMFKLQNLINSKSENLENAELKENVITTINNAIEASKAAIKIDKNNTDNYLSLASIYSSLILIDAENKESYYQNAKSIYMEAENIDKKDPNIPMLVAELDYLYDKNSQGILDNINKSLSIKKNYSPAYYALSQIYSQKNDKESAIKYIILAIQSDNKNVNAYIEYSRLILESSDISKEELNEVYTALVTVLNLEANNNTAKYYLAMTYILADEFDNAKIVIDSLKNDLPNEQKILDLENLLNKNIIGSNASSTNKK